MCGNHIQNVHPANLFYVFAFKCIIMIITLVTYTALVQTQRCAASVLPLEFFPCGVILTRKHNNQYLLKEGSIPASLMNAAHGCARALVSDCKCC